ncbi:hypothetical protein AAVH_09665 [Aphelenchoides avenae]|nr:hypothetical protein AAVH_09665 [Aphelenchus avenae]
MVRFVLLAIAAVCTLYVAECCNIIVHVKSDTDKKFQAQVVSPTGQKSDKWTFTKNRQRETFQQRADECGVRPFEIVTYDDKGSQKGSVKVSLDGVGRVLYTVGDDLKPTQTERQGAICSGGQCAALAETHSRPTTKAPPTTRK